MEVSWQQVCFVINTVLDLCRYEQCVAEMSEWFHSRAVSQFDDLLLPAPLKLRYISVCSYSDDLQSDSVGVCLTFWWCSEALPDTSNQRAEDGWGDGMCFSCKSSSGGCSGNCFRMQRSIKIKVSINLENLNGSRNAFWICFSRLGITII